MLAITGGLDTDACGFDPSPQAAKEICVAYKCGTRRRYDCWPSNTARIDLICTYPPMAMGPPRTAAEEKQALEQERAFLASGPCPVAVPEKK
jgi:hypothetical protein